MKNLHNLGAMQWREDDMRVLPMRVHCCHQGNRQSTQFFPHTPKWTGVFAPRAKAGGNGAALTHGACPTTQPKGEHPACVPFCGHWTMRPEKTIFIMRLLKPLRQTIFYLINLQTILGVNFVLSLFHRCRNWELQTHVTYKSHSWWEAKSGFQCTFVWLQGLCSLLCKRLQPH